MKNVSKILMGLSCVALLTGCGKSQKQVDKDVFLERANKILAVESEPDFKLGDLLYVKLTSSALEKESLNDQWGQTESNGSIELAYDKQNLYFYYESHSYEHEKNHATEESEKENRSTTKKWLYYEGGSLFSISFEDINGKVKKSADSLEMSKDTASETFDLVATVEAMIMFGMAKSVGMSFLSEAEDIVDEYTNDSETANNARNAGLNYSCSEYLGSDDEKSLLFEGSQKVQGTMTGNSNDLEMNGSSSVMAEFRENKIIGSKSTKYSWGKYKSNNAVTESNQESTLTVKYSALAMLKPNVDDYR